MYFGSLEIIATGESLEIKIKNSLIYFMNLKVVEF
jgi:hypothetical protein